MHIYLDYGLGYRGHFLCVNSEALRLRYFLHCSTNSQGEETVLALAHFYMPLTAEDMPVGLTQENSILGQHPGVWNTLSTHRQPSLESSFEQELPALALRSSTPVAESVLLFDSVQELKQRASQFVERAAAEFGFQTTPLEAALV